MASLSPDESAGSWRICYRDQTGRQRTLRLGKCAKRTAEIALQGFERVLESHRLGSALHPDALRWVESVDDRVHARLARLGFVQPRQATTIATLAELLSRFEATLTTKASTKAAYAQAIGSLRAFFGESTPLPSITPARADEWRASLSESFEVVRDGKKVTKRLSPATVAKRIIVAKMILGKAVRWGLMPSNPFEHLRAGSQVNAERLHYVSRETIARVLAACPDDRWRAIVALSRYAGLRCPSETGLLKWEHIDFARGRMVVHSPKTSHHAGHAHRVVPLVPELRDVLMQAFENAPEGEPFVVPALRDATTNLRTTFQKIIVRASEKPWPRLFHAMRASCACDFVERFPNHVAASWLGHSPLVAAQHYLGVRDSHFDLAAGVASSCQSEATERPAQKPTTKPTTRPTTKPTTHAQPCTANESQPPSSFARAHSENDENEGDFALCGVGCDSELKEKAPCQARGSLRKVGEEGFEPPKT
jgi:integrase